MGGWQSLILWTAALSDSHSKASHSYANDSTACIGTVGGHVIILPGSFGHCLIAEVVLQGCWIYYAQVLQRII